MLHRNCIIITILQGPVSYYLFAISPHVWSLLINILPLLHLLHHHLLEHGRALPPLYQVVPVLKQN